MAIRSTVPNLVVAQRVIDKMTAAASEHLEDETGEAMVGFVVPGVGVDGVPTIYALDTISPDESAVRQMHTFQQGDERQDELIWWLQENWRVQREKRRDSYGSAQQAKWDVPLRYLGDWHKQPGYMIAPSGGDLLTALDWLDDPDNNMDALLAPIVTLDHPATTSDSAADANFITVPRGLGTVLRVDFWYIHRDVRVFQPIRPVIYPDDQLPGLTSYPWHLVDQERARHEFGLLQDDGLFLSVLLWDVDDKLPLEICVMMARQGADRVLIVGTSWDYPQAAPRMWTGPFINMGGEESIYDAFAEIWEQAEPVKDPPGWEWSPDKHLTDYVHAVEDALGIRPPETKPAETDDPQAEPVKTSQPESAPDTAEDER
jgi:hypothetical protein